MTESPNTWSFEQLQIKLPEQRTIRRCSRNKRNEAKKTTARWILEILITKASFLPKFFFMKPALLHLLKSKQNRT